MPTLRQTILTARMRLTMPLRTRRLQQLASEGMSPMSVLFYHRVADSYPNDWTIRCQDFEKQIEYCRDHFAVISLEELQRRSRSGFNAEPTVSITFDDGYAENCRFAIPLLIRHQIPCTYFVALDNVREGKPFQHDLERKRPLPLNTFDEIRAMADGGVEIGLHTRTHYDFSKPTSETQVYREITSAVEELSDAINRPVRYFAFPYGMPKHLLPAAIDAVREAGLIGYCSAYGAYNFPAEDPFHIRRFHGDPDMERFRNWLTFDQKKVRVENARQAALSRTKGPTTRRPLRTMFVMTSMPVGGAETLLVNMMDRFDQNRIKSEVLCLKEPGALGEKIRDRHLVHSDFLSSKWDLRVLPRLARLIRDRRIDALVTVGAGDKMFWGRLAAKKAGVPVICSAIHSTGWPDGIGKLNRMLTGITDRFIAVADHHGEFLRTHERIPADKVKVVRNGIDCDRFVPSSDKKASLRRELSLPQDAELVGIVAALRTEKNHPMFIDVARLVCAERDNVHFVIVGDGPERPLIESLIEKAELQKRVRLLGTRHDTPNVYAGLDLFLLCSHNEASPVSILESLACEVPVISTRVGSVAESVIEGETGFLVDRDDRLNMSSHVLSLLGDSTKRERLGRNGRSLVLRDGSLDSMVSGYTEMLEEIYERKHPGPKVWKPVVGQVSRTSASINDFKEVH